MSQHTESPSPEGVPKDTRAQEIGHLVGLLKRLEQENTSLRRALAAASSMPA